MGALPELGIHSIQHHLTAKGFSQLANSQNDPLTCQVKRGGLGGCFDRGNAHIAATELMTYPRS